MKGIGYGLMRAEGAPRDFFFTFIIIIIFLLSISIKLGTFCPISRYSSYTPPPLTGSDNTYLSPSALCCSETPRRCAIPGSVFMYATRHEDAQFHIFLLISYKKRIFRVFFQWWFVFFSTTFCATASLETVMFPFYPNISPAPTKLLPVLGLSNDTDNMEGCALFCFHKKCLAGPSLNAWMQTMIRRLQCSFVLWVDPDIFLRGSWKCESNARRRRATFLFFTNMFLLSSDFEVFQSIWKHFVT